MLRQTCGGHFSGLYTPNTNKTYSSSCRPWSNKKWWKWLSYTLHETLRALKLYDSCQLLCHRQTSSEHHHDTQNAFRQKYSTQQPHLAPYPPRDHHTVAIASRIWWCEHLIIWRLNVNNRMRRDAHWTSAKHCFLSISSTNTTHIASTKPCATAIGSRCCLANIL